MLMDSERVSVSVSGRSFLSSFGIFSFCMILNLSCFVSTRFVPIAVHNMMSRQRKSMKIVGKTGIVKVP
jgi:hypothetical protein